MAQKQAPQPRYSREALLHSRAFAHIHPDFLKAILQKEAYTMEEAQKEINRFFKKE